MIGKTNVNGTNDASGVGAVLSIDAPTGSTVTVSQGSFSKVLKDSIKINALFSRYFYLVKPSRFGSWTITATDGTRTASGTVLITSNKEYEITITYDIIFVEDGILTSLAWVVSAASSNLQAAVTQESGAVLFTAGKYDAGVVFGSTDSFDLSDYATLRMVVSQGSSYYSADKAPCIAIGANRPTGSGSASSATNLDYRTMLSASTGNIAAGIYTLDVSSLTGAYYVGLSLSGNSSYIGQVRVTDLRLVYAG